MYNFTMTNRAKKQFLALGKSLQKSFELFFAGIVYNPFLNKLSENIYHAHIKYKWVAVWSVDKPSRTIIVTYIGSREGAPY